MAKLSRRNLLKVLSAGSGTVLTGVSLPRTWQRPVVETILTPAHAQATCGTFIRVTSPFSENGNVCRVAIIANDSDTVLARCCCGLGVDIIVQATDLSPGTYRVFGDSDGPLQHTMVIETGCETRTVTVPTNAESCNFLMATVALPAGSITEENGQQVGGDKCDASFNCLQGNTGCGG